MIFIPELLVVCFIGLMLGSFATALAWRAPRGENWITTRSRCISCGTPLKPADLIPLFSWLLSKGRCRHCGAAIGRRYPLTELAVLAGCLGVYAAWGFSPGAFIVMATVPFLVAAVAVDIEKMILPDQLTLTCAGLALVFLVAVRIDQGFSSDFQSMMLSRLGAAILFPGLLWLVGRALGRTLRKETVGFGDVKFFAMAGLWLGISWLPLFLILSGGLGILWGLAWRLCFHKKIFPFGPALVLALYACLILQGMAVSPDFLLE